MFKKIKDPISTLTHFIGLLAAIPVTVVLIVLSCKYSTPWHIISFSIFGAALILLYTASTVYHMLPISEKAVKILRRIDHMMIFLLIAGTYTPICLVPLRGPWGWSLLVIIWLGAFAGILLKAFWINAPKWLSTSIYLVMGWLVVVAFYPLVNNMMLGGVMLLLFGGITYSIGAFIYAFNWPKLNLKYFGSHEIFHLFVMGGSAFHIVLMYKYILNLQ